MDKNWKSKIARKKARGNQTSGSQKGLNCQAISFDKYCAKRSRAYKHPNYQRWLDKAMSARKV